MSVHDIGSSIVTRPGGRGFMKPEPTRLQELVARETKEESFLTSVVLLNCISVRLHEFLCIHPMTKSSSYVQTLYFTVINKQFKQNNWSDQINENTVMNRENGMQATLHVTKSMFVIAHHSNLHFLEFCLVASSLTLNAALAPSSNTSCTPLSMREEHSMYFTAPMSMAHSSPCW